MNNENKYKKIDLIEDEIDCAILSDDDVDDSMEELNNTDSISEEEIVDDIEPVDVNINYDNSIPAADIVDIDADDIIAAERDIIYNPFEDDEIIDTIVQDDDIEKIDLDEDD